MFPKLVAEKNLFFFDNFEIFEKYRKFSKSRFFYFQRIFTIFEKSWFREFSKIFKNLKNFEKIRFFFGDQLWEHTTFLLINRFWIFLYGSTRNFLADSTILSKSDFPNRKKSYYRSTFFGQLRQETILNIVQFREITL